MTLRIAATPMRRGRAGLWAAGLSAWLLSGCLGDLLAGKGGGSETETKVTGKVVGPDGRAVVSARVIIRSKDYVVDPLSPESAGADKQETRTDAQGGFRFDKLPVGAYRIEAGDSEGRGFIRDCGIDAPRQQVALSADTLKSHGRVEGRVLPDSGLALDRYVQVKGMERLAKADSATGAFSFANLPPGRYDLRCIGLYRKPAVKEEVDVGAGGNTQLGEIRLEGVPKLAFRSEGNVLRIESLGASNPLIYDNEIWNNGVDNEYVWAKASAGLLDFRGNVVTGDFRYGASVDLQDQLRKAGEELRVAQLAGLRKLPGITPGAASRLALPVSGKPEDIRAMPTPGSDLIVAEARKADPGKPLIVLVGGPLTTVANAYLTDPSIAARLVVFGIFSNGINSQDTLANYLVVRKLRFVHWGHGYAWDSRLDSAELATLPGNIMGDLIRGYAAESGFPKALSLVDLAPVAYLFRPEVWKSALKVDISPQLEFREVSGPLFDALDIPQSANDWALFEEEALSTFRDPAVYHPWPVPARLEAEACYQRSGAQIAASDSGRVKDAVTGLGGGTWVEYRLEAQAGRAYPVLIRYRAPAGGRLTLGKPGDAAPMQMDLPPADAWSEASVEIRLGAGASTLRVSGTGAAVTLDRLDFR